MANVFPQLNKNIHVVQQLAIAVGKLGNVENQNVFFIARRNEPF
jgi:hypothetical protein